METSTKVAIGVGALIVIGGGIAAYIILNKKKPLSKPADDSVSEVQSNTASPATNSLVQQAINNGSVVIEDAPIESPKPAYTPPVAQGKCSQVRSDYDKNYIYKKCDGVWFTMKNSIGGTKWVSLADPKWAGSVAKLNAKYPND